MTRQKSYLKSADELHLQQGCCQLSGVHQRHGARCGRCNRFAVNVAAISNNSITATAGQPRDQVQEIAAIVVSNAHLDSACKVFQNLKTRAKYLLPYRYPSLQVLSGLGLINLRVWRMPGIFVCFRIQAPLRMNLQSFAGSR